jgi:ADP-ribosylglycohydrolase
VRASILAGAIGDAIGSAVEFSSLASIVSEFGPDGVRTMASHLITDDTQMTLFTAQGLLEADPGAEASAVLTSYLDWLGTQPATSHLPESPAWPPSVGCTHVALLATHA